MKRRLGRRGLEGIQALILFMAIMIVSFTVGITLYNTSTSMVRHDQAVQAQKTAGIQRPIVVEHVRAVDLNGDRQLDEIVAVVRLRPGDGPVSFNGTFIIPTTKALTCNAIKYGPSEDPACTYELYYGKKGNYFSQDWLNEGDLVEMRYHGSGVRKGVEDLSSKLMFVPSQGFPTEVKFEMPERVYPPNIQIWPVN